MKQQLIEGEDFYYNEQGYMVLTAAYHIERGHCCGNGCMHCPFGYERVGEPRRSELLKVQEQMAKDGRLVDRLVDKL